MCLAQGPQRSDAGEARTRYPSVSSQALYHWATALPHFQVLGGTGYLFFHYWPPVKREPAINVDMVNTVIGRTALVTSQIQGKWLAATEIKGDKQENKLSALINQRSN